jgi:hypothetical protein
MPQGIVWFTEFFRLCNRPRMVLPAHLLVVQEMRVTLTAAWYYSASLEIDCGPQEEEQIAAHS